MIYHLDATNFEHLKNLQILDLSRNGIFSVPPSTFRDLNALRYLDLSLNSLRTVSIFHCLLCLIELCASNPFRNCKGKIFFFSDRRRCIRRIRFASNPHHPRQQHLIDTRQCTWPSSTIVKSLLGLQSCRRFIIRHFGVHSTGRHYAHVAVSKCDTRITGRQFSNV